MLFPHYILVATLALRWSVPLLGSVVVGTTRMNLFHLYGYFTFPPPSSARKRRCAERTIDLNSFFSREERSTQDASFPLMSCAEEGKTFKTVSAVRLARAIEEAYGKLQAVVRQRNGTILFEARTDEQIGKN